MVNYKEITKGMRVMAVVFDEFFQMIGSLDGACILSQLIYFQNIAPDKRLIDNKVFFLCNQTAILPRLKERTYRRHLLAIESLGFIERNRTNRGTYIWINYEQIEKFKSGGTASAAFNEEKNCAKKPRLSSKKYSDLIKECMQILGLSNIMPVGHSANLTSHAVSLAVDSANSATPLLIYKILILCIYDEHINSNLIEGHFTFKSWQKMYLLLFGKSASHSDLGRPFELLSEKQVDYLCILTILRCCQLWVERISGFPGKNGKAPKTFMTQFRKIRDYKEHVKELLDELNKQKTISSVSTEFIDWFNAEKNKNTPEMRKDNGKNKPRKKFTKNEDPMEQHARRAKRCGFIGSD